MPVLSWGHSQYWQGDGQGAPPAAAAGVVAYVPFQIVILSGCGFGVLQAGYEALVHTLTTQTRVGSPKD